jgi:hypothetical protein
MKNMFTKNTLRQMLCALLTVSMISACSQKEKKQASAQEKAKATITLVRNDESKKVDVLVNGELFTSYIYPETVKKPVLYPLITSAGNKITRGYPLEARPGERVDHPHHVGLWFNYGDVNGLDFWNNSDARGEDEKQHYGTILHKEILNLHSNDDTAELEVAMDWVDYKGERLLKEQTKFVFRAKANSRTIDRITTLTALDQDVDMKDNKEGVLGIRVARELEHVSDKPDKFTDANGVVTEVAALNNEGVTGMYRSSENVKGEDVWGTRAKWMTLAGSIRDEKIAVAIFDHPENVGFPTYWHARGYGLYAANPLGQKAMSNGKEELNFKLPAGESVTFKHRIIIYSGDEVADKVITKDYDDFAKARVVQSL